MKKMNKTFKVNAPKVVEEGKHEGVIIGVEYREKPFEYTDLVIEFGKDNKIKAGYPSFITPVNKLGRLMIDFGCSLTIDAEIDPVKVFVGKKCTFMTMNKTTTRGTFPSVVSGSLKPMK